MNKKLIWLILVLEYVFILGFLMNYDNAWMHSEKLMSTWSYLDNGYSLKFEDFERGFDHRVPEMGLPRIARPLSHMFDLLNAKFRAWLWQYIPPHPSLSLTCLFSLTLLPIMLFYFFRNMGCRPDVALVGVCLYLASAGFLIQIPMLYHASKSFVNIFAVACLWQASRIVRDKSADADRAIVSFWRNYTALLILVFISFFWDETGLFIYAIIALVMFPVLRAKRSARYSMVAAYACLPVLYLLTVKIFLPNLHQYLGHGKPNVSDYFVTPSFKDLIMPNLQNLFTNAVYLFNDQLHFYVNSISTTHSASLRVLFVINDLAVVFFIAALIYTIIQYLRHRIQNQPSRAMWYNLIVFFALCMLYIYFHNWLLSRQTLTWGCAYYGAPFSLLFTICLTCALAIILTCYRSRAAGMAGIAFLSIMVACSLVFVTYRNNISRIMSNGHMVVAYESIFSGRVFNMFNCYNLRNNLAWHKIKYRYIRNVWDVVNGRPRRFADQDTELAKPQTFTLGPLRPVFHGVFDNVLNESQSYVLGNTKGMLNAEIMHTTRNPTNFVLIPDQLYFADVNGDKMADALYWDTSISDRGYFFMGLSREGTAFNKFVLSLVYPVEAKTWTGGQRVNYADVNGDGKADMLYYETVSRHMVFVSLATGSGFTSPVPCLKYDGPDPIQSDLNPRQLQFADVNGDRLADAVYFDTRRDNSVRVSLFIKEGQRVTITSPALWAQYNKSLPEQLQVADVNGDGKADAIYFDFINNGLLVGLSTGTNFAQPTLWAQYAPALFSKVPPGTRYAASLSEELQYADVNGDGKADALFFNRTGSLANSPEAGKGVWVRLSTGTQFAEPTCWLTFEQIAPHVMRYADVNGDGKADALFVDPVNYQIMVGLSTGSGFSKPVRTETVAQRGF